MKSGYDQFFKNVKKAAQNQGGVSSVKMKLNRSLSEEKEYSNSKNNFNISQSSTAQSHYNTKEAEAVLRKKLGIKSKKKRKISWKLGAFSLLGLMLCIYGFLNTKKVENWLHKIEVSYLGAAEASESAPSSDHEKTKKDSSDSTKAHSAEVADKGSHADSAKKSNEVEANHLDKLVERKKQLDDREQELNHVEEELAKQKVELDAKLKSLEEMRQKISGILEERVKVDEQKVDSLMQMYSNMKPPQAAKVFESMDEDLAVEILGRMKKKNAAEILNLLKPEKAQIISEKYAGYKRVPASSKSDGTTGASGTTKNENQENKDVKQNKKP